MEILVVYPYKIIEMDKKFFDPIFDYLNTLSYYRNNSK